MLRPVEKEMAFFGASVAAGCKPCMDYHIEQLRIARSEDDEIRQAIADAVHVRSCAQQIMESYGLALTGITTEAETPDPPGEMTRLRALVCTAAAFALNCTTNLEKYIVLARSLGVNDQEISSVLDAAVLVKGKAALYAEQAGQLQKEVDQLQQMLNELQEMQAQLIQSEKMAALGKVVAGVVHEINGPLGVLTSVTDVTARSLALVEEALYPGNPVAEMQEDPRVLRALTALKESVPAASEAASHIDHIITSLRSFAQLDEAPFQTADVHQGLESTLTLIGPILGDGIQVVREYGDLPLIQCYPAELNQAFHAILSNAARAISGRGRILIRTSLDNGQLLIEVSDTGCGIPPGELREIFVPRFLNEDGRVRAGLGLFIAYNVVKRHRGDIDVESEVGRGSKFTISLPLDLEPESPTDPHAQHRE